MADLDNLTRPQSVKTETVEVVKPGIIGRALDYAMVHKLKVSAVVTATVALGAGAYYVVKHRKTIFDNRSASTDAIEDMVGMVKAIGETPVLTLVSRLVA